MYCNDVFLAVHSVVRCSSLSHILRRTYLCQRADSGSLRYRCSIPFHSPSADLCSALPCPALLCPPLLPWSNMLAALFLVPVSARFVCAQYLQPHSASQQEADRELSIAQQQQQQQQQASEPQKPASTPPSPPLSQPPVGFGGDILNPIATTRAPRLGPNLPDLAAYPASAAIPAILFRHPHPFDHALRTHLAKYTHCKDEHPDVLECITLKEAVDPQTGVVYRRRLLRVRNTAPWLFRSLLRSDVVEFEEESVYDERERVLQMASQNVSYRSIIEANEASKFIELREGEPGAGGTLFVQTGTIRAGWVFGPLRSQIESYAAWYVRRGGVNAVNELEQKLTEEAAAGMV